MRREKQSLRGSKLSRQSERKGSDWKQKSALGSSCRAITYSKRRKGTPLRPTSGGDRPPTR